MKLQKKLLVTGMILLGTSLSASATNMDYEDIKNNKIICKPSVGQTTVVQNVIFDLDEKSIIVEKNGISTKVLTENQPRNFPWEAENQNVQKYLQNSWLKVSQNNNDEIIVSLNLKLKGGGGKWQKTIGCIKT